MSAAKHTPTPWKAPLGRGKTPRFHIQTTAGYQIASTPELKHGLFADNEAHEANAAHIVKCVNAHDGLVAFVKQIVDRFEREYPSDSLCDEILSDAKAHLAKIGGAK